MRRISLALYSTLLSAYPHLLILLSLPFHKLAVSSVRRRRLFLLFVLICLAQAIPCNRLFPHRLFASPPLHRADETKKRRLLAGRIAFLSLSTRRGSPSRRCHRKSPATYESGARGTWTTPLHCTSSAHRTVPQLTSTRLIPPEKLEQLCVASRVGVRDMFIEVFAKSEYRWRLVLQRPLLVTTHRECKEVAENTESMEKGCEECRRVG